VAEYHSHSVNAPFVVVDEFEFEFGVVVGIDGDD
jgi:hypothetical protein